MTARIPVGANPYGVDLAGGYLWVANSSDQTVSKIDPARHRVAGTVAVGSTAARSVAARPGESKPR